MSVNNTKKPRKKAVEGDNEEEGEHEEEECPLLNDYDSDDSDHKYNNNDEGLNKKKTKKQINRNTKTKTKHLSSNATTITITTTPTTSASSSPVSSSSSISSPISTSSLPALLSSSSSTRLWPTIVFDKHEYFSKNIIETKKKSIKWQIQLPAVGSAFAASGVINRAPNSQAKSTKHVSCSWRLIRRKQFLALVGVALLIFYVNTTLVRDDDDERIPVVHYSHVPGMKAEANQTNETTANADAQLLRQSDNKSQQLSAILVAPNTKHRAMINADEKLSLSSLSSAIASAAASATASASASASATAITNATLMNFASAVFSTVEDSPIPEQQSNDSTFPSNDSTLFHPPDQTDISSSFADVTSKNVTTTTPSSSSSISTTFSMTPPPGYLVWSEHCKMVNIDPYLPEVMKFFKREKYQPCSSRPPLTVVEYNDVANEYVLRINKAATGSYSKMNTIKCCYQSIERNSTGINADKDVSLSKCIPLEGKASLQSTIDNILVKCHAGNKQVYADAHAMMPERKEIRERLDAWKRKDKKTNHLRPPSVLMLGIDSISRINLIRAMPKTAQYLYDNEWFEMSGYNKIDDNTFPNLMAILTGWNKTNAFSKCPPTVLNGLDNCPFIWNTFREHGYVTAYAEDEASINTFNYLKVGFEKPPADYYLRPFLLSAEKHLPIKRKSNLSFCLGSKHSADYVYDYALELAKRYRHDSFFGLFWTNTFSHNDISDCSSMDEKIVDYLRKFAAAGTLENTIVIFFSDHGIRFGPTRKTLSGHLEERLPFMFIWMPQHLKQAHPEFVNALSVNKNRLTNPYDMHMTLKHLLAMSGRIENADLLKPAEDCPRCQTLFEPVPHNRSCEEIAIADHWCTCILYKSIYKKSNIIQKMAMATVDYINDYVTNYRNGSVASKCLPLKFSYVDNAYRAEQNSAVSNDKRAETYRILFHTKPNMALFEATVRYNASSDEMKVTGEISRLNSYGSDSTCIDDGGAKKYCSCPHKKKG